MSAAIYSPGLINAISFLSLVEPLERSKMLNNQNISDIWGLTKEETKLVRNVFEQLKTNLLDNTKHFGW